MRIASLVTNDLHQDQRMNRICGALQAHGHQVTLIGRKRKSSGVLGPMPFLRHRLMCFFEKGPLFYIEYNIRLFVYLLTHSYDVINANDLDTILPAIWAGRLRGAKIVYDAHEYFTEQEEVVNRPPIKAIWKAIERYAIPKTNARYTVSEGYARLFEQEYHKKFEIVRNATVLRDLPPNCNSSIPYILYQGAVNYGRGLEEMLQAMQHINSTLYICGAGDALAHLQQLAQELKLGNKVKFWGFIEPEQLRLFTCGAHIGLTLFAKAGLSHYHSLANRFFDYMHAGVPQIAMQYPEYVAFNQKHQIAVLIDDIAQEKIALAVNQLLNNPELYQKLATNTYAAKQEANWQMQEKVLLRVYQEL